MTVTPEQVEGWFPFSEMGKTRGGAGLWVQLCDAGREWLGLGWVV